MPKTFFLTERKDFSYKLFTAIHEGKTTKDLNNKLVKHYFIIMLTVCFIV